MGKSKLALTLALGTLFFAAQLTLAANIQVGLECALADAIVAANSDAAMGGCAAGDGADTIMLSGNVLLGDRLPLIKSKLTINGLGKHFISGDNRFRIFVIGAEGKLTLRNLTLARGNAREEDAVCGMEEGSVHFGGAVCNLGELIVLDSLFTHNEAERGGAIYSSGSARMNGGNLSHNTSESHGGAIYMAGGSLRLVDSAIHDNAAGEGGALFSVGGSVSVKNSVIFDNEALDDGGAMRARGSRVEMHAATFANNAAGDDGGALRLKDVSLLISSSTFSENAAEDNGGAIYSATGTTRIVNSSFHGNSAGQGGALASTDDDMLLKHVTIVDNSASDFGGGVLVYGESETIVGRLFLQHSIVARNENGDCHVGEHGQMVDSSHSLVGDASCAPMAHGDPGLGELVQPSHGGPAYFPLNPDSLAIDAGDPFLCLAVDQVGVKRPQGAGCDLGAIEYAV